MIDKSFNPSNLFFTGSAGKRALVYLILLSLFATLFNLGGRPIEFKDYLEYAEIAREVLEFRDWVMLHENGKIYVDKPPLHFWLTALSYKVFGVNPFAARLPSALAAFCGMLLTFFFVRRFFGKSETAFMAAIILLSAYDYLWWARRTRIDMLFFFLFSASIVSFYCSCETTSNRSKTLWYLAFWLATGLAFMDKAFIALSNLVVVIPYSAMVIRKRQGRKISAVLLAVTSPCLLLPVVPWIIALANHPEFSAYWEILERTKIMTRQEAFYYYLVQMPLIFLPATPFCAMGIWGYIRHRRQLASHRELGFALLWIVSYMIILHLTVAKSTRYLLPIYLPCSLISAWAIGFYLQKKTVLANILRWGDRIFLVIAGLSLLSLLFMAYYYCVTLSPAFLYVLILSCALLLARKFLPLKAAGLFVSFIIIMLVIDAGDTIGREKTSPYYRMHQLLLDKNLKAEQIAFHKCFNHAQSAMGFYFNQVMHCSDNLAELDRNPKFRAIVATREAVQEIIPPENAGNPNRIISCYRGWVIFIKQN